MCNPIKLVINGKIYNNPIIIDIIKFFKMIIPIIEIIIPIISNIIPSTYKCFPLRQLSVMIPEEISRIVVINRGIVIAIIRTITKPDANARPILPAILDTSGGLKVEFNKYIARIEIHTKDKVPNMIENQELILKIFLFILLNYITL